MNEHGSLAATGRIWRRRFAGRAAEHARSRGEPFSLASRQRIAVSDDPNQVDFRRIKASRLLIDRR